MKAQPRRYANLLAEVRAGRARRILEVGTYKGAHAEAMIRAAAEFWPAEQVEYYGLDLFGPAPAAEHTPRTQAPDIEVVRARLEATGARIVLVKGDSRETFPRLCRRLPKMGIIFIDGGHSEATIESDWLCARGLMGFDTSVIFDDHWNYPGGGGCNKLIAELAGSGEYDVNLLEPMDRFARPYGFLEIRFARVRLRESLAA